MERGLKMFLNGRTCLLLTACFASTLSFVYGAIGGFPTIDFVEAPLSIYTPKKPSLDAFKTRGELAYSNALATSHSMPTGFDGLPDLDTAAEGIYSTSKRTIESIPRATKFEVEMAKILYWRIKTDMELSAYDVSLTVLEKLVMELFRKFGFNAATCQALLVKERIPNDKAMEFCYNLEPFALLECHALTWLDFSVVMDIKFRMKRRGMFLETKDVCRLVERVKPSLIPKPEKKSIFGKCQTVVNSELMRKYGVTNMDVDMVCTVMDYTIQPACADLSKDELSEVMKLGLHLGDFVYPRIFPIFVSDICIARKMMKRGPSRERCRNALVRVLVERADEYGESVVVDQWPLYTEIWRSCAYVYKRKATGGEKMRLDKSFTRIAFGSIWSDRKYRGQNADYPPSKLAYIHGETVEVAPDTSEDVDSDLELGSELSDSALELDHGTKSEGTIELSADVGSESSMDLGSDMSIELDEGRSSEGVALSDGSSLDIGSAVSGSSGVGVYGPSVRSKYHRSSRAGARKSIAPRERWVSSKTKALETPDQFLWSTRQSVALNSVQKAWAQVLYSLYSQEGNKAYGIEDFEVIAARIDPTNMHRSCSKLVFAKIKKYPGHQRDGVGSRFSETTIASWCAAIDGARSKACQSLSVPAQLWSNSVLKSLTLMRDESNFAIDLRDVCRFVGKVEPWNYTKKGGFTNHCIASLSEPLSTAKHSSQISFLEKYKLNEKESKQMCLLLKPANHKSCIKLSSGDLTLAYKLAFELGKIHNRSKKLQVTYDSTCKVIARVGRDSTIEHCILATAEFVGYIAVDSDVAGKEFESGVATACGKVFEAKEPAESTKLVSSIIEDVYSDIAKHMPPQSQDFDIIRRKIVIGDELIEETRNIRGVGDRGFGHQTLGARLYSPTYFKPTASSEEEYWTPFGVDPALLKKDIGSGIGAVAPITAEQYYEKSEFPSSGFTMDIQWVEISGTGFKKSLSDKLKDEFVRTAPPSLVVDQSNIPDFASIVGEMDLAPNAIYVSCVKVLKKHRVRSEVAQVVCKRIDPYATPACNGLMIVLLDHAEFVHSYLTSLVKKEAFDLADFCKAMHALSPFSDKSGTVGNISNTCVRSPVMFNFQKKYSLSNKQMTKLCSKLDFTRTESFARLTKAQRGRVIFSSRAISILISDKYQDVYAKFGGVFWARNIPRVSIVNMINLISHTGEESPIKEKCEYECQSGSPFFTRVLPDSDICYKSCMAFPTLDGQVVSGDEAASPGSAQFVDLRPRTYETYDRYGSTEEKPLRKVVWWMADQ
ncbi:uncharacterized protein ELE39_003565 [Cryptosporidium sp. chipmunk genotype I]|uniref:uncharacterized protein n=1 Tax=Cryptosporidium sp. chipmunk genotype I TaxID=1280935 RepID=UPI003519E13B|nr:hypothetical protein ELE39_003565 [Cryptosporidium sp. chipmunk genotype I]